VLTKLLIESQKYSAEYDHGLSNHLPMALFALHQIGGTPTQLEKFYSNCTISLNTQTPDQINIDSSNWKLFLGQHRLNSAYRLFYLAEMKALGRKNCLSYYLPGLMPGISGGAFHPLIRLAYALQIDSDWEIAESLASWSMAYQELGPLHLNACADPIQVFQKLNTTFKIHPIDIHGENIFHRLKNVSDTELFKNFFSDTDLNKLHLKQLSEMACDIYLSSNDSFTALHFVTSAHAYRIISLFLNDTQKGLSFLFQGLVAGYLTINCPDYAKLLVEKNKLPQWPDIFAAARETLNDHVIKFAYTSYEEFKYYKNDSFQLAAAKKSGLV
jgi:hypothetical protein